MSDNSYDPVKSFAEGLTKPFSDVGIALINKISDAANIHYEPKRIVAEAKAQAEAAKIQAESDADVAKIQAESKIELTDKHQRALIRWIAEQEQQQESIESIIAKAFPKLNEDADPSAIEDDWIIKFFDKCRLITDDKMQDIWISILAGEANSTGSYSPKALTTLADMNQNSLSIFNAFCSLCLVNLENPEDFLQSPSNFNISNVRLPIIRGTINDTATVNSLHKFNLDKFTRESTSIYKRYGFDTTEFLLLLDHGLIADDTFVEYKHFWYNNEIYRLLKPSSKRQPKEEDFQKIAISGYRLTSVGTELFKIAEFTNPSDYLRTTINFLQRYYRVKIVKWKGT